MSSNLRAPSLVSAIGLTTLLAATTVGALTTSESDLVDMSDRFMSDTGNSYLSFSLSVLDIGKIEARMRPCCMTAFFDPARPERTSVTFRTRVEAIDTGNEQLDEQLRSSEWLDGANYPTLQFVSRRATATDQGMDVTGDLTIKDVTRQVTFRLRTTEVLRLPNGMDISSVRGGASIDRLDFGIEGHGQANAQIAGRSYIGRNVDIEVALVGYGFTSEFVAQRFLVDLPDGSRHPVGHLYGIAVEQGIDAALADFERSKANGWPAAWIEGMSEGAREAAAHNVLSDLGWILMLNGHAPAAIAAYERSLQEPAPDNTLFNTRLRMGDGFMFGSEPERAREQYESALEFFGEHLHAEELLRHLR